MLTLFLIAAGAGFLAGVSGQGGSALVTPLLQLAGVPAFFAVASPLPAGVPGTLAAGFAYIREGLHDRAVVAWSLAAGLPAAALGAWLSRFVGGSGLLLASNLVVGGLGLSFLLRPTQGRLGTEAAAPGPEALRGWSAFIGAAVGLLSGLLANAGGFLLAPLYMRLLRLPLKRAFGCSLVTASGLALPGAAVHILLGHVSWPLVGILALGSLPTSYLGARLAVRLQGRHLEPVFGATLLLIGALGLADALGFHLLRS